ncbi:MAG TPA: RsmE family RNA methyltransferase [Actinomycetota bacterium]
MGPVELSPEDAVHALRALRLRPGEAVSVADGSGRVGTGTFAGERNGAAVVDVDEVSEVARPQPRVTVVLAPPKGERLRWAIQKLSELGVARTVLVEAERSVRALPADRGDRALNRLRATAREAAMQSRQAFIMEIGRTESIRGFIKESDGSAILLWELARAPLRMCLPPNADHVSLIVGPEGGFSEHEVDEAREAGAAIASVGPNILRTETAAVAAAAVTLAHYGRLG